MKVDFIKGQMGGNRILILDGRLLPEARVLPLALRALGETHLHAHQAGILYPSPEPRTLRVRAVSVSWQDFISACGGLTQVLGRAVLETSWAERFDLDVGGDSPELTLAFDAWPVTLTLKRGSGDNGFGVTTDLTSFVQASQQRGIVSLDLDGVPATGVGSFLVLDAEALRHRHPQWQVDRLDAPTREGLVHLQCLFHAATGQTTWDVCLYDTCPVSGGDLRVVFPHRIPMGHIEASCGTGSLAAALALHAHADAARRASTDRPGPLRFESGGDLTLGGPDLTTVSLRQQNGRVTGATFTHSNVTLTARGCVDL